MAADPLGQGDMQVFCGLLSAGSEWGGLTDEALCFLLCSVGEEGTDKVLESPSGLNFPMKVSLRS